MSLLPTDTVLTDSWGVIESQYDEWLRRATGDWFGNNTPTVAEQTATALAQAQTDAILAERARAEELANAKLSTQKLLLGFGALALGIVLVSLIGGK